MRNTSFIDNFIGFFFRRNILSRLILINVIIFILANLYKFLFQIQPDISLIGQPSGFTAWFAVPSNPEILLQKPWTVFTYMFLHENFFHLFFNMLMLYFGGTLFMQFLDGKKLLSTYILGGITGAAFYVLAFNYFPVFEQVSKYSVALGASASVIAIVVAIAFYIPDYTISLFLFGRIKMKYLALLLVVMDLLMIDKENPGGHIAHIGGALWGIAYVMSLKKNRDMYSIFNPVVNFFRKLFKPKPKLRVEYKKGRPLTDDEYTKDRADKQKKIDIILDKISKSGYESLSREEKDFLFSSTNKK